MRETSWKKVGKWYGKLVGEKGHYYHQQVIIPGVMRLVNLKPGEKVLDLACGQGVLGRQLPQWVEYAGVDIAPNLIEEARLMDKNIKHKYLVGDVTRKLATGGNYNWVTIILALQNIREAFAVIRNAAGALADNGKILIVLNHPAFRIPKHSDWEIDKEKNIQSRKVDKYMSPLEIPIESSPFDKKDNQLTFSYHYPLSAYSEMLFDNGFLIEKIEEWVSDKVSTGGAAKRENRARKEFPMFMTIVACRRRGRFEEFREGKNP